MAGDEQPRFERLPDEETIRLALEAISDRDAERLQSLLADDIRVITERSVHSGREAVARWSQKAYDHLERRWALEELRQLGEGWIGRGQAQYAWRDSGEVADASPVWFSFRLGPGGLSELAIHADEAAAAATLAA